MQTLNAQDSLTGETVRFDWDGSAPPSDADLEHIFGEVRRQRAVAPGSRERAATTTMVAPVGVSANQEAR
jgi:hypothetical protein